MGLFYLVVGQFCFLSWFLPPAMLMSSMCQPVFQWQWLKNRSRRELQRSSGTICLWEQTDGGSPSVTGSGFGVVTTLAHLESLFLFCVLNLIMLTFISLFFKTLEPQVVFWVGYMSRVITTYRRIGLSFLSL